jgi:hypothetical protein
MDKMDKMYKVKMGAIVKIVPSGALKWYIQANWKVLGEVNDKTNTKKNARK